MAGQRLRGEREFVAFVRTFVGGSSYEAESEHVNLRLTPKTHEFRGLDQVVSLSIRSASVGSNPNSPISNGRRAISRYPERV